MPSRLIEIPPNDIFKNDRLGLEPAIQVQSEALLSHSPQAIAIDAPWGSGKTTFMALWEAYLKKEDVKVVTFNAWKSSLLDPLDALTREILCQFESIPKEDRQPPHSRLAEFVRRNAPLVKQGIKLGTLFSAEIAESAETLTDALEATIPSSTTATDSVRPIDSPEGFTCTLSSAAKEWSSKPVTIMVDELDRCSPEYAVEMLQLLEHVFYAENVVFVVSMNRAELVHSVRAFYGQGFNADGYLERFFDNVFPLPASNRFRYIRSSLTSIEAEHRGFDTSRAVPFLHSSELSLREIDRAVNQLDEVLHSYTPTFGAVGLVYLWLVRTLAPVEYRQFVSGETSDRSLAEATFANGACAELREESILTNHQSYAAELEGELIIASCLLNQDPFSDGRVDPSVRSKLYAHHKSKMEGAEGKSATYSSRVIGDVNSLLEALRYGRYIPSVAKVTRLLDRDALPA